MQHFLKAAAGTADAGIVPAELLDQLFVAVHDAVAALDVRLRGITGAAFARARKSSATVRGRRRVA
jgi:hypothetical protein